MTLQRPTVLLPTLLLSLAAGILIVAFIAISLSVGSFWPWALPVHEDGIRTLTGTIFYFEHAARELPLDIVLGIATGGSILFVWPPSEADSEHGRGPATRSLGLVAALFVIVITASTVLTEGLPALLDNLLQKHTRPGAPLELGSHWSYHLLSRFSLILISLGLAAPLRLIGGTVGGKEWQKGLKIFAASLLLFLLLSLGFSPTAALYDRPFSDPVYLGHQARELFTHALVTVPAAWGTCLLLFRGTMRSAPAAPQFPACYRPVSIAAGTIGMVCGGYVCIKALLLDSASQGQTEDLATLVFPHFFEHGFSYLVVPSVAALVYGLGRDSLTVGAEASQPAP